MGGSSGGSTNTTPWGGQQPFLMDVMGEGQALYNMGIGNQYYPGQTVAPFSPMTQSALDMTLERVMSGSPEQAGMSQYVQQDMQQPGFNAGQIAGGGFGAMQGLPTAQQMLYQGGQGPTMDQSMAYMYGSPGVPQFGQIAGQVGSYGGGMDPRATDQLGATASGAYLGSNPYLDATYDQAAGQLTRNFNESVMPGIASMFGQGGRTGGGIQQQLVSQAADDLGGQLGDLATGIYGPAYEAERGRQVQAAQNLGQLGLSGRATDLSTIANLYGTDAGTDIQRLGLTTDLYNQGMNRSVQAGGHLGDLSMTGMSNLSSLYDTLGDQRYRAASLIPSLNDMGYGDIDRMMQAGGMVEDQTQRLIDAERDRFNFYQTAPWGNLSNYGSIVQGLPAGYGMTETERSQGSRVTGAAGGAMMGYQMGGPYGAVAGGILGAMM